MADAPSLEDLAHRLREFLHARDLKQREAARLLNVPQSTISRLLNGRDVLYSKGADVLAKLHAHEQAQKPLPPDATVTDVMTRGVKGVDPNWSLRRTQKFLARHDYSHAPLLEGAGRYGDLVSRRRVLDTLASGTDAETPISRCKAAVTDGPAGYVNGSDSVTILQEQLRWHPLLLVRSSANRVKGVVTRANLSLLPADADVNQNRRPSYVRRGR